MIALNARVYLSANSSRKTAKKILHHFEEKYNGHFSPTAFKGIIKYQTLQQIVLNDSFAQFIGRNTNEYERYSNTLFYIASYVYDEILDTQQLSFEALNNLFENPHLANPQNFNEVVLMEVHKNLLERATDPDAYYQTFLALHHAQKDSTKQIEPSLSMDEIVDITLRKGGYSAKVCSYFVALPRSNSIEQCWYEIGSLIQMVDDLFDVYDDIQEQIRTFANTNQNFKEIEHLFNQQLERVLLAINNLPFSISKKQSFVIKLSLLPALGIIALKNLGTLENKEGQLPNLKTVPRKSLIIDMEKLSNIFKMIRLSYILSKQHYRPSIVNKN
jgi:hypothetical protein